jgi:hypothetical protein
MSDLELEIKGMNDERVPAPPNTPPPGAPPLEMIEVVVDEHNVIVNPEGNLLVTFNLRVIPTGELFSIVLAGSPDARANRFMAALRAAELLLGETYGGALQSAVFTPGTPEPEIEATGFKIPNPGRIQ